MRIARVSGIWSRVPILSSVSQPLSGLRTIRRPMGWAWQRGVSTASDKVIRDTFLSYCVSDSDTQDPLLHRKDLTNLLRALGVHSTERRMNEVLCNKAVTYTFDEFKEMKRKLLLEHAGKKHESLDSLLQIFRMLDRNGDGYVTADELTGLISTRGSSLSPEQARRIVDVADKDHNGSISESEFIELLTSGRHCDLGWVLTQSFRVVLVIGGPGSGKGVLCERIQAHTNTKHLSSGDLLRDEVNSKTALGRKCEEIMLAGQLIPSSAVTALLRKNMSEYPGQYIALDGFPRSVENCRDFFSECGKPDFAIHIDVPDTVMMERILSRGALTGRQDDNVETAKARLQTFHSQGQPTLECLRDENIPIYQLDGTQEPQAVWEQLLEHNTPLTRLRL